MPILEPTNLLRSIGLSLFITLVVVYHLFGLWYIFLNLPSIPLDKLLKKAFHSLFSLINTMESLERTLSILAAVACLAWFIAQCINPPRYYNHVLPEPPRGPRTATHPTNE